MSPDRTAIAEAALEEAAILYADLNDAWNTADGDIAKLADRMRELAEELDGAEDRQQLCAHIKGQSDGLFMALRILRERRATDRADR